MLTVAWNSADKRFFRDLLSNISKLKSLIEQSNISDVNLSGSKLAIVNQITNQSTDGNGTLTLNLPTGITSAYFDNFDTQKYSIHYNDGTTETLTKDQFDLHFYFQKYFLIL